MKCPECGKETQYEGNPHRPFCSERCKLIDLGNWAGERYRMPTKEALSEETHPSDDEYED